MRLVAACGILSILCACSGGGGGGGGPPAPAPSTATTTVSGLSPFDPGCGGAGGTLYLNAEVEPHLAVDPRDANHLVGVWQQDRWSNGSSRGDVTGVSFDGGLTWTLSQAPFSNCTGGNATNGGDYLRATDPWVAFAPDGTVHQISLSTSGGEFAAGSANAVLASRSADGGRTWSNPVTLLRDGASGFNDKETLSADPTDARFVYAVWDRITRGAGGPSWFARTTDGGASWEPARVIYDPGPSAQTIANLIRVLPDGTLVDMYLWLRGDAAVTDARVEVIRSTDRGVTWSQPITISAFRAMGARDPVTGQVIRDGSIVPQMAVAPNGTLYVVWQDARFSGTRDAIALSRSTDGGLTWSAPVSVNGSLAVAAFTPQVHVRADGVVGVTYFDLRSDTGDPATLLVDYWLARSSDGVTWSETRVSPAFDIATAPVVDGAFFLGDYMGLASAGDAFLAFYARTTGNALNRTDVFMTRVSATATASKVTPEPRLAFAGDAEVERRSLDHLAREKSRRLSR